MFLLPIGTLNRLGLQVVRNASRTECGEIGPTDTGTTSGNHGLASSATKAGRSGQQLRTFSSALAAGLDPPRHRASWFQTLHTPRERVSSPGSKFASSPE